MENPTLYVILMFAAFGGFLLAFYIAHKKRAQEVLVCPLNSDCEAVVRSEYSRFFGIPVERLGLLYYGLIFISYGAFLARPALASSGAVFLILTLSVAAFLFSLYLTFIQVFTLRQLCTWCLTSAGLCTIIFLSALFGSEFEFVSLLSFYRSPILILHLLGAALGLGAATVTDILFFRFLKDFRVSEWEANVLSMLSQVIWFALVVVVVSGVGLYLSDAERLNESSKFLVKTIVVLAIIINGAFLNLLISPRMIKISFGTEHNHEAGELRRLRRLAFALGAVSLVSGYMAFILGAIRSEPLDFITLLLIYFGLLALAVLGSQIIERWLVRRAENVKL